MTPDTTIPFDQRGEFTAYNAAVEYLKARGFSVGAMQGPDPVGILFGRNIMVAKWRCLNEAHRAELHGTITGLSKRGGPITVTIFASAPDEARRAVAGRQAA